MPKAQKSMFVVILRYLVSVDLVDTHRPEHINFLDAQYAKGIFIASGGQVPRTGGIILAKNVTRTELVDILKNDPFSIHKCAEYQIYEFIPTKWSPEFSKL